MDSTARRIDAKALLVAYAMSRLDRRYLELRGLVTWRAAYSEAAAALSRPAASVKNLRDEFDPFHGNLRRGWHRRPIRSDREACLHELSPVSDEALLELAARILAGQDAEVSEAIDVLAGETRIVSGVAERLLTGRLAEEHFLRFAPAITGLALESIVDMRLAACGYDFGVATDPDLAIEVKGLRALRGPVRFTDREWSEAQIRGESYLLVVVGRLPGAPLARVFRDPTGILDARCRFETALSAAWDATVDVRQP